MKQLLLLCLCVCALSMLHAQTTERPDALTFKYVRADYYAPPTKSSILDMKNTTHALELGYFRNINKFLNVGVPLKFGQYKRFDANGMALSDKEFFVSFDGLFQFNTFSLDWPINPYVYGGGGALFDEKDNLIVSFPIGGGVSFKLSDHVHLQAGTEYRIKPGSGELGEGWNHSIGVMLPLGKVEPPPPDTDEDGIIDAEDDCPFVAGLAAFNGCPDTDGDGIADKDDACPEVAGLLELNGCPDTDGDGIADKDDDCPNEKGSIALNGCPDRDGDGVADKEDECPDVAGLAQFNGCPPPDTDGDGILDQDDKCPTVAGLAAFQGCPDTDGDGITDAEDRCPNQAGPASNKGCPEMKEEEKEELKRATRSVQFETNRATIKRESYPVLNTVVELMKKYPQYSLDINGHTDSQGSAEYNLKLSKDRARACYDYIVGAGIKPNRISSEGYGEDKPIADNRYASGRAKNRRVEFIMEVK